MKSVAKKRCGFVLPLVLCAVLILSILGVSLLTLGSQTRLRAIKTASDIAARCAADAALTKAIYDMNTKLATIPWNDSSLPSAENILLPGCDAFYSYTVTKSGSNYLITATGNYGNAQKQVTCTIAVTGPFDFSLFGNSYLWLANSCTIDQYNTDLDTPTLKIGTSSTSKDWVTIGNGAQINGDVVVGVGADPADVIKNSGTITGNQYAMTTPNTLASVTVPSSLTELPSQGTLTGGTLSASAKYSRINLGHSGTVTINGNVTLYVTGDISLGQSAQIDVNPGSSLTLYLGGNLSSNNNSGINNLTLNPHNMKIFALDSCEKIEIKNSSVFYGAVYAPKADIMNYNFADMYGSFIGASVSLSQATTFHYDASLRNATVNDPLVKFKVTKWSDN